MGRKLGLALLAGGTLRVALWALLRPSQVWDGALYTALAEGLRAGRGYVSPLGAPTAFFPPGLPLALAAAPAELAPLAVNLVAFAVSALAVSSFGDRGHRAAWCVALYPGLALWSLAAMTETLAGALAVAAVAVALGPFGSPGRRALGAGALVGLLTLVRPQGLLLAPLVGALVGTRAGLRHRARTLLAALSTVAALGLVAPWTARNSFALGGPVLVSTNQGSNLYLGTLPEALGGYQPVPRSHPCLRLPSERERDRCLQREGAARAWEHPARWVGLGALKLLRTLAWEHCPAAWLRDASPLGAGPERALTLACTLAWWALLGSALRRRGVGVSRTERAGLLVAAGVLLAPHALFLGDDRFHLAVVPLLAPLASRRA